MVIVRSKQSMWAEIQTLKKENETLSDLMHVDVSYINEWAKELGHPNRIGTVQELKGLVVNDKQKVVARVWMEACAQAFKMANGYHGKDRAKTAVLLDFSDLCRKLAN